MELKEFVQEQKQLLDDFAYHYVERKKNGKERSLFQPERRWIEALEEFLSYRRDSSNDNEEQAA